MRQEWVIAVVVWWMVVVVGAVCIVEAIGGCDVGLWVVGFGLFVEVLVWVVMRGDERGVVMSGVWLRMSGDAEVLLMMIVVNGG